MTLWVFGYGSLLWDPGFTPSETARARLDGYHRSFCMLSIHHRGSKEDPGLVLALDRMRGGQCVGLALRVAEHEQERVLTELRERELISSAYYEDRVPLALDDGREIEALTYIVDTEHRQYCRFELERQAQMIAHAVGGRGPNVDYLNNTAAHLRELGIDDAEMRWLVRRVAELRADQS